MNIFDQFHKFANSNGLGKLNRDCNKMCHFCCTLAVGLFPFDPFIVRNLSFESFLFVLLNSLSIIIIIIIVS